MAFLLRANSNLYTRVHSRRLQFTYLDLLAGLSGLVSQLNGLQPQVLIAPASVLALLRSSRAGDSIFARNKW